MSTPDNSITRPYVAWCWPCLRTTLHDGVCHECAAREAAAERYNVEQEMLHGTRDRRFTDGLACGAVLTSLLFLLIAISLLS